MHPQKRRHLLVTPPPLHNRLREHQMRAGELPFSRFARVSGCNCLAAMDSSGASFMCALSAVANAAFATRLAAKTAGNETDQTRVPRRLENFGLTAFEVTRAFAPLVESIELMRIVGQLLILVRHRKRSSFIQRVFYGYCSICVHSSVIQ